MSIMKRRPMSDVSFSFAGKTSEALKGGSLNDSRF